MDTLLLTWSRPLVINACAIAFAVIATASPAANFCREPSQPYCLSSFTTWDDGYSFEACRQAMDSYLAEVAAFSRCLGDWVQETADEAQRLSDAAVSRYQNAVTYWNCQAAGPDSYCGSP